VWQPNRAQWSIIWAVAVLLVLAWPPGEGKSLGAKTVNWLADPAGGLPSAPEALPMSLDDDGDAVAAHDALEQEYYRAYQSSTITRTRLTLKEAGDPFDATTERQLIVGLAVLAALAVWRLDAHKKKTPGHF
jgi:hypothetical protein